MGHAYGERGSVEQETSCIIIKLLECVKIQELYKVLVDSL